MPRKHPRICLKCFTTICFWKDKRKNNRGENCHCITDESVLFSQCITHATRMTYLSSLSCWVGTPCLSDWCPVPGDDETFKQRKYGLIMRSISLRVPGCLRRAGRAEATEHGHSPVSRHAALQGNVTEGTRAHTPNNNTIRHAAAPITVARIFTLSVVFLVFFLRCFLRC